MTVANASAFLDELNTNGATPELLAKIETDFTKEHVSEALKARGNSKDQLLAHAAGGSAPTGWATIDAPGGCASAAGA
jgi:hypothetical protein